MTSSNLPINEEQTVTVTFTESELLKLFAANNHAGGEGARNPFYTFTEQLALNALSHVALLSSILGNSVDTDEHNNLDVVNALYHLQQQAEFAEGLVSRLAQAKPVAKERKSTASSEQKSEVLS